MSGETILVIEDNELNMKLVRSLLQLEGFRVLGAENAEIGLEMVREHLPDLVLMDIQLPGMDGLAATRILREEKTIGHIPVVALTSYAMVGDKEMAMEAGCTGFLPKPIDTRTFLDSICQYIGNEPVAKQHPADRPRQNHAVSYGNRILVVDDDPLNVKLLASQLSIEEYDVRTASTGEEALRKVAEISPDLILLDIMMPGMDGLEVTRRLKADPATEQIPIILITALHGSREKEQGLAAGAEEFLNKPVSAGELKARVQSLMRIKRYREQLVARSRSEKGLIPEGESVPLFEEKNELPVVLLVEDEEKDILLIQNYLVGEPYELRIVRDGEEALHAVQNGRVDLVLLDIFLPGINGFDICRHLRESAETQNIQVVVVTCLDDMESRIHGIQLGSDDFLVKPVNRDELRARIQSLLRKKDYMDSLSRRMESALSAAITDQLTGLFNHSYFKHFLAQEIRRSQRQQHPLSLLMIDIDDFKNYNDTNGHLAGDNALQTVGRLVRENIRDVDFAARYGGEELAVILPYTGKSAASAIGERIRLAVFEMFAGEKNATVTISVGGTSLLSGTIAPETFIKRADKALYAAKAAGKNRLCFESSEG